MAGSVVVFGAGKMGLPVAAQFAGHGWRVTAVDVDQAVVDAVNAGQSHLPGEQGLAELVERVHAAGRLRATSSGREAVPAADVVVVIVPVALDREHTPDYEYMDAAVEEIGAGIRHGTLVIFETTLPVGETRDRFAPRLEAISRLVAERDFFVAFSPERIYSGSALRNLATYPKLVGGIGDLSGDLAARFYDSVLDAEIVLMSSAEAAELSKLAETTYRDVNIALANEYARYAERVGVDVGEVIAAANSQPYSHIHQPGIGVGGHCIPVYPHFLLWRAPDLELVATARHVNDGQAEVAIRAIDSELGRLTGVPVLILGIAYRAGVRELANSPVFPLVEGLGSRGAVVSAYDPSYTADEIENVCAPAWTWGERADFQVIVTQTADPRWLNLNPAWFPNLRLLYDGRNSLGSLVLPEQVKRRGPGVLGERRVHTQGVTNQVSNRP